MTFFLSYWAFLVPVFSACVWLAMLIAMLATWSVQGYPHYSSMDETQNIAYISDVGAQGLKPLFVSMSAVTVVSFDLVFIFERWLRHTGRLAYNTSIWQKIYSALSIIAAIAGGAGLILLSVFDTVHHPRLHNYFLALFIGGYIVSAIFICWEYQRLGIHFRQHAVLRISFWIKLFFILFELALCVAFGVSSNQRKWNVAAVLEWVISFVYFFYVLSFFIDFLPALRTKNHRSGATQMDMARMEAGANGDAAANGGRYYRGQSDEAPMVEANTNGNGVHPGYPKPEAVPASRNF
ncbi:hypothetical protein EJ04DRAFT_197094 [Polyplosphaeria fusca]|uniref:CWH43-like N-terminal domain-containing protein n=1 Tax=Polyplosphaeria fusca TaxID=682080 RepID=A0A9P4RBS6_9PLEO|nr:hypothetical protein EJ04DRAFT_197094 [Polyplosphaeria fusca]